MAAEHLLDFPLNLGEVHHNSALLPQLRPADHIFDVETLELGHFDVHHLVIGDLLALTCDQVLEVKYSGDVEGWHENIAGA
jgi:hypothetical protein